MPEARSHHGSYLLGDDKILISGGDDSNDEEIFNSYIYHVEEEKFDSPQNTPSKIYFRDRDAKRIDNVLYYFCSVVKGRKRHGYIGKYKITSNTWEHEILSLPSV